MTEYRVLESEKIGVLVFFHHEGRERLLRIWGLRNQPLQYMLDINPASYEEWLGTGTVRKYESSDEEIVEKFRMAIRVCKEKMRVCKN